MKTVYCVSWESFGHRVCDWHIWGCNADAQYARCTNSIQRRELVTRFNVEVPCEASISEISDAVDSAIAGQSYDVIESFEREFS